MPPSSSEEGKNGETVTYAYDNSGNIATMTIDGVTYTYTYDDLNQLTAVATNDNSFYATYTYNAGGNLVSQREKGVNLPYVYLDSNWRDKLTHYKAELITYDGMGNPTKNYIGDFSWEGRQLTAIVKTDGKVYRWTYQSVKNVLVEESYTGLLVNHRTETHGRTVTPVSEDEQYRHENFFPVIIDREEWGQVQALLQTNAKPYRGNTASHRYARLLTCGDCGSTFVPRIRCWNGSRRVEYLCKSYMHHGRGFCPSHHIRESELDARVQQYAEELRSQWMAEQADLCQLQRLWEMKRPAINVHIADLYAEIQRLEQEIDDLLLEKIQSGG